MIHFQRKTYRIYSKLVVVDVYFQKLTKILQAFLHKVYYFLGLTFVNFKFSIIYTAFVYFILRLFHRFPPN